MKLIDVRYPMSGTGLLTLRLSKASPPPSEPDFTAGQETQIELVVVSPLVVETAEREPVVEIGLPAPAPGMEMMNVAPGEGTFTALDSSNVSTREVSYAWAD